ncbi:sulfite exporter TauE/SafE family protein [Acidiferrobacter sp.]|uniref:sulfite exporter TauE/SafE family protein n=1 Tax=Acidiferrobacter sp. TaxID=1872107 RepID=UPI002629B957|nr:sulfite exporter TauE/SafE family protein [Acidiferrobacter sp.]
MDLMTGVAGIIMGLVLGVFGSGGSIITTPALIYLAHLPPKSAIATSLGVIAITAAIATFQQWRRHNVNFKITAIFSLFSVSGAYLGTRLGVQLTVVTQLVIFACAMYAAAWKMLQSVRVHKSVGAAAVEPVPEAAAPDLMRVCLIAVAVGVLAGLVGVGGGFLIVPSLVLFCTLPIRQAIGTSLAIVTLNSSSGFLGYVGHVPIDYMLVGVFSLLAVAGSIFGTRLAHRLAPEHLKRVFGAFLIVAASAILAKNLL